MKLRSSGHDPTCALFITQDHVMPLPFPKSLSKLMTPKHWLQEPHLQLCTNIQGSHPCALSVNQHRPKWSCLWQCSQDIRSPNTEADHWSFTYTAALGASPCQQLRCKWHHTGCKALCEKEKLLPHSLGKGSSLQWPSSYHQYFTSGHNTEAWTRDKWINRQFLFKELLKEWSLLAWVLNSNINYMQALILFLKSPLPHKLQVSDMKFNRFSRVPP